jgi:hypothetical protein
MRCSHRDNTLYLAELLNQDRTRRFGYADDVCIFRATHTLESNVTLLGEDMRAINEWGVANKTLPLRSWR